LLYLAVREYRRSAVRQIVFYYLLALNFVGGFWLVYAIIATELQNRRERREREIVLAAQSEIMGLTLSRLIEQQQLSSCDDNDVPETLDEDILGQFKQLQNEINKRVVELERESFSDRYCGMVGAGRRSGCMKDVRNYSCISSRPLVDCVSS
jgi:hypothetical protein